MTVNKGSKWSKWMREWGKRRAKEAIDPVSSHIKINDSLIPIPPLSHADTRHTLHTPHCHTFNVCRGPAGYVPIGLAGAGTPGATANGNANGNAAGAGHPPSAPSPTSFHNACNGQATPAEVYTNGCLPGLIPSKRFELCNFPVRVNCVGAGLSRAD